MADLTPLNYNPDNVEDMGDGLKVVPPGIYNVVIVESDIKDNKNKTGKLLEFKYQIMDGQHVGDTLTDRINLTNPNETCQKIGQSELKHICEAVGHKGQLTDSTQLHGKPLAVKVVIEKFKSNKDPNKELESNKVEKRMFKQSVSTPDPAPNTSTPQQGAAW